MKYKIKRITARVLCLVLISAVILTFAACSKGEKSDEKTELTPVQIINEIFSLTKAKDYDKVAGYCRSFSPYSVELYFTDTGTEFESSWTERYSSTLHKLFTNYVTCKDLSEKTDKESRTATVTGTFTAFDMEKFNEKSDSKINSGLKNDFNAQMDYIDSLIGSDEFRSDEFSLTIDFRYTNDSWVLADKNFLLLLTLGYYNK